MKIISNFSKKKRRIENYSTSKTNYIDLSDNINEKIDEIKAKPKLFTGMHTNNLFLLGNNKYYTIKKLRQQVDNFNTIDSTIKKLEIIQSNVINNNNEKESSHINKQEIKDYNNRETKTKLIKFSQRFKNYHLSFVPLSVKYNEQLFNFLSL